jgi:hypothetical protein
MGWLGGLGLFYFFIEYGWTLIAAWALWSIAVFTRHLAAGMKAKADARREEARAIAAQADLENAQWLGGALYEGQYPAATMPLTSRYARGVASAYEPYDAEDMAPDWGLPPDWSWVEPK